MLMMLSLMMLVLMIGMVIMMARIAISIMTIVVVMTATADMKVGTNLAMRWMRNAAGKVSKYITHHKDWYQQNRYKPVHP